MSAAEPVTIPERSFTEDRIAVSPREAARLLGISHDSLYELLRAGRIPSVKLGGTSRGGRRLIAVAELHKFMAEAAEGVQ